ncbi:MAG: YidB family protein [Methylibium sp.]|jgi:uncharacterized protein YidB (DUF937 family)|uniref:YidB family protein n=1 Tax=unclassified Methylibium TaxID=2633235 RepID=UPI0006FD3B8E|nr:YidB family protein [Methylibium sp. Root1272]KQW68860.1 hypothetical protein ASC67_09400 [Methylibium sp. Root1272]MDP1791318.1 YidB family protein [Methylibium sp.]
MGLLDSVIGALGGSQGSGQGDALQAVIAMLARGGQGSGGLDGLVQQFQQGGLGDLIASWVGTGQNLPVSASQLQDVLGSDMLSQFAQQLGLPPGEAAGQLSQLLPQVVDKLTPNGQLSDIGSSGLGDLGSVLERFSRP